MENLTKKDKITIIERIAYGLGDFGCNIIYTAMTAYLLFYYTDYAGVSAAAVGTIIFISRIFDGFTDIIMGHIVDRTHTKHGKARPWILRMAIPFAISGILLFSVPANWGDTAKLVYVFVTYNLVSSVVYTAINVPYSSLNALMTQDAYERSVLSIFRNLLATCGTLLINAYTLTVVEYFGNNLSAWTKTFALFGCLAFLAFLTTYFFTTERVQAVNQTQNEHISLVTGLKALFKNKYWMMVTGLLVLLFISMAVNGGSTVYYAKVLLGDEKISQTINSVTNLAQILCMFAVAPFIKRLGKRNSMVVGCIIQTAGLFLLVFGGNAMVLLSSIVRGIGGAFYGAVMWAMISDTVDYGEWVTGLRMEGLTNSASSFGYKVGNGVGTALLGVILSASGYVATATTYSSETIFHINLAFWILPTVIAILILGILYFYRLDQEFDQVIGDLQNRKSK